MGFAPRANPSYHYREDRSGMLNRHAFVSAVFLMVVFVFPSRGEEALIFTDDFESGTLAEWDAEPTSTIRPACA